MRFSEKFELENQNQSNFAFVNIRVDRDNRLCETFVIEKITHHLETLKCK
ncbi:MULTISPECIES: hypothetical protein [unclassified Bacillus cereus group]